MCYFATRVIFLQLMFWLYVILIVKPCAIYNFTYVNCPILKVHVHDRKDVSVIFLFIKTELLWPCWQCLDFGKKTVNEYREIIEFLDYHYWIFLNHKITQILSELPPQHFLDNATGMFIHVYLYTNTHVRKIGISSSSSSSSSIIKNIYFLKVIWYLFRLFGQDFCPFQNRC